MVLFVALDHLERASHVGVRRDSELFAGLERAERFANTTLVKSGNGRVRERSAERRVEIFELARTERAPGVAARQAESEARVLDLVSERSHRIADERRRRAEREQLECEARERRDRCVLRKRVFEPSASKLVARLRVEIQTRLDRIVPIVAFGDASDASFS